MIDKIMTYVNKLTEVGVFNNYKSTNYISDVSNTPAVYNTNIKQFSLNNVNNYVYLGSTNSPLLNNMGITLDDDGTLMLIKGKTYDLFTGLIQKYFNGGFKYKVFHINSQHGDDIKFKELYVDYNGFLIGSKRDTSGNNNKLYKIKFKKIEGEYNLSDDATDNTNINFIIEYEKYEIEDSLKHDLSNINNIIEKEEGNVLKINREGMPITITLKDNKLFTYGLPPKLIAKRDVVDGESKKNQIKLPLKPKDKILAIKPVLNKIQLVVDKGNKIKIYYFDPLHIFALKDYHYEITRLTQEPPLSFYSMVGKNNYKNYHSGQPFSTQKIGNFSAKNIPFFSSAIDNARVHFDRAKQQYALKKYGAMVKDIAKSLDPGFRGMFSTIKAIVNSATLPRTIKTDALNGVKKVIKHDYNLLNKYITGINNGKSQGEVVYSLVEQLNDKESITISQYNDIRAFFGISAFHLSQNIGVSAFLLANFAKTHALTISKNKQDEVVFSFVNKMDAGIATGLSAGIMNNEQKWREGAFNYGFVTPLMATVILDYHYEKKSNFSFKIQPKDLVEFINQGVSLTESELKDNATLEFNRTQNASLGVELRSEVSFDVGVSANENIELNLPRNAVGANLSLKIINVIHNINKFIGHGETKAKQLEKNVDVEYFSGSFELYRDLKFTPSATKASHNIHWYPLTSLKNFEVMLEKRVNSLFKHRIYDGKIKQDKKEFEAHKNNLKGLYKRVLKINNLFDKYPVQYDVKRSINKLDHVYLQLDANKKLKNKLNPQLMENDLSLKSDVIDNSIDLVHNNNRVQQFLADLTEKKKILSSQKKNNMNEKFKPYFISKYQLNSEGRVRYSVLETQLEELINEVKTDENLTVNDIKDKLDNFYNNAKQELNNIEYQLNSIDVMSISELADKAKSFPLAFLRLESKKSIMHHQVKGEINFLYDKYEKQLEKITTNYYFH